MKLHVKSGLSLILLLGGVAQAANIWVGTNGALASVGSNWSLTTAPTSTDDIQLDNTSTGNMTWDAAATPIVASWTQTTQYTGTVTFKTIFGASGFTNFTITGNAVVTGGTWTHAGNSTAESNRLQVTVGGNLTMGTNTSINAAGLGFATGQGISVPGGTSCGGTYGGIGANWDNFAKTGVVYGSISSPTNLGSGGNGAGGGGAIILNVAGTFSINSNSTITANGSDGYGAGAGGSVFITAGNMTGAGTLSANGGNSSNRGGAGGGRIAVILTSSATFSGFTGAMTAYGGPTSTGGNGDGGPGAAGTVYNKTTADNGVLIVNNNGQYNRFESYVETLLPTNVDLTTFTKVIITNSGLLAIGASNPFDLSAPPTLLGGGELHVQASKLLTFPADCVITGNYTLVLDTLTNTLSNLTITPGASLSHRGNYDKETYKLNFSLTGNLTIQSNASINVDGKGYFRLFGQGCPSSAAGNTGGSYGGQAGNWDGGTDGSYTGAVYGSISAPTNMGSGSRAYYSGGGAVILNVAGTTSISNGGLISAVGQGGGYNGGGSGGSIFLTTGQFLGGGTLRADGGSVVQKGGGGGGRIAVVQTSAANFSGFTGTMTAYGGYVSDGHNGAAGTVYKKTTADNGILIVDYSNRLPDKPWWVSTVAPTGLNLNSFTQVIITNQGVLTIDGSDTLDFGSMSLAGGGNLDIRADTLVTYPPNWTISGCLVRLGGFSRTLTNVTIAAGGGLGHMVNWTTEAYKLKLTLTGNLTVLSNGTINVDSCGFPPLYGTGCPNGNSGNSGASYGGLGGAWDNSGNGPYSIVYGSILAPTNIGSGSRSAYFGGGAIILNVAGTTSVSNGGLITACGQGSWKNGGGSGGTIFLTTGQLQGGGTLQANGGSVVEKGGGGGGRISVVLTNAASFSSFTGAMTAYGGAVAGHFGTAGTVYRKTPADAGFVIIDNNNVLPDKTWVTTGFPSQNYLTENLKLTQWTIQNRGWPQLTTNLTLKSFTLAANTRLELGGYTLTLSALTVTGVVYKSGTYTTNSTSIFTDAIGGGKVVVTSQGTAAFFR